MGWRHGLASELVHRDPLGAKAKASKPNPLGAKKGLFDEN